MSNSARFQVDSRLATLLGEAYRSSEQALKELVDNAWDADATIVRITLPEPMTQNPIVIADNGTGMTEKELRSEYLFVANDRTSRRGAITPGFRRKVKGQKGIGKFAGLMAARNMIVETTARGVRTRLPLDREELREGRRDLEKVNLIVETTPSGVDDHGTTITLLNLNQHLEFPSPDKFRALLMLEYGRQSDFALYVNEDPVDLSDIPGETYVEEETLSGVGIVRLRYTISAGKKSLKEPGIIVRIGGKTIGKPSYFGLDDDELVPAKLLKRVYGEIEADGLADDTTADWGVIVENSIGYAAVRKWAGRNLRQTIEKEFTREMSLAKARHQLDIDRALAKLPEYRRPVAQKRMERLIKSLYSMPGLTDERVATIVSVSLDAVEYDDYWIVIAAIDSARCKDVATFAESLENFGIVDLAVIGTQTRRRLEVLDRLDELIQRPETHETQVHRVIEKNLWVLGSDFVMLSSNQTHTRIVETYTSKEFSGARAAKRPDLLLCEDVHNRHLLIEFKRPDHAINRDDEAQAVKYRDDLRQSFANIEILLLGKGPASTMDAGSLAPRLRIMSLNAMVSAARMQHKWLLHQLSDSREPE